MVSMHHLSLVVFRKKSNRYPTFLARSHERPRTRDAAGSTRTLSTRFGFLPARYGQARFVIRAAIELALFAQNRETHRRRRTGTQLDQVRAGEFLELIRRNIAGAPMAVNLSQIKQILSLGHGAQ